MRSLSFVENCSNSIKPFVKTLKILKFSDVPTPAFGVTKLLIISITLATSVKVRASLTKLKTNKLFYEPVIAVLNKWTSCWI